MSDPKELAAALESGGSEASNALSVLADQARPNAAYFDEYITTLLSFVDSTQEQELRNLSIASMCSLIERTEFSGPEPLLKVAPFVLPPIIHALAVSPRIQQLSPALETLWLANRSETEQALRQWGLVSSDVALRLAALSQLETWVSGLNGRFAFRKFTPLVVSLLRDTSEEVRVSSYRLIVKFFASTSSRAREDLAEIMRKQQISEVSREKIMTAISNELNCNVQGPSCSPSRPSSQATTASNMISRTPTPPKSASSSEDAQVPVDMNIDIVLDSSYAMQPLDAVNIFSEEEFLSEVSSRLACFEGKETEWNWSQRQEAVQRLRQMLRCTYVTISPATLRSAVKMMQKPFNDTLLSLRTTLVGFTCQALKDITQLIPQNMIPELLDPLIEPLSHVAAGIKKITASAAHVCMCAILIDSPSLSVRQFQIIKSISQSKKPHARTYALYWLKAALITSQQPVFKMDDRIADIEQITVKGITDAVHTAREGGRELYWVIYQLWPDLAHRIRSCLPASAIKTLQASQPKPKEPTKPSDPVAAPASQVAPMSPRPKTLTSTSERPVGLGTDSNEPNKSINSTTQSTPKAPRTRATIADSESSQQQIPALRQTSLGISDSLADLSIREPSPIEGVDLGDYTSVRAVVKEYGALCVLRKLAISSVSPATSSMVLRTIRELSKEVTSAADIAKLIQTDLSGASITQRLGYLQLLEHLNYEQDTVESVRPATSPAPSSIRRTQPRVGQIAMYVDSESSGAEMSPRSSRSRASIAASSSSSMSSIDDSSMAIDIAFKGLNVPNEVAESFNSAAISPFPSTEPACKTYIEGLVQQVEQQTAKPEVIAALAVLVTASATPQSRRSPLFAAIEVWHRSYTFDMHLRDTILKYLSTRTDIDSVFLGLVLLRALIVTPTQTPASAYLEPLACLQCLLEILNMHAGKSLEIDEHALPAARDAVIQPGRSFGGRSLLELLARSYEKASKPAAKAFIVQTLDQVVKNTGLLVDEGAGVLPLVMKALDDSDAQVRKEAYPVLVTIHKQNELLGTHAQTRMRAGQLRLLQYYLEIS